MDLRQRKQIRLKGYDYSEGGYYFVTICAYNRELLFGEIINKKIVLNQYGNIAELVLKSLKDRYPIVLDVYQIMPNHIHMILIINSYVDVDSNVGVHHDAPIQRTKRGDRRSLLSVIMGYFKMNVTKQIHQNIRAHRDAPLQNQPIQKIFQRNYYEHIIRNEKELYEIKEYIGLNPIMWDCDRNNPKNIKSCRENKPLR